MIINMNGAKAPETPSPVLQEKTVTPETLPTVIGADEGYDGLSQVTVNPDSQLKAENIRSGKTIFGVTGAFTGETIVESRNAGLARALCGPNTPYDSTTYVVKAEDWGTGIEAITGNFKCNGKLDLELPHMDQFTDPTHAVITSILTNGGYSAIYTLRLDENDVYYVNYLVDTNPAYFFGISLDDVIKHFVDRSDPLRFPQVPFITTTEPTVIPSKYTSLGYFNCAPSNISDDFTLVIPETITSIGGNLCSYSRSHMTVKMLGATPPSIDIFTFSSYAKPKKIIVPQGSLGAYQTATYWKDYASIMEEATE